MELSSTFLGLLLAFASGVLMAVQGGLNSLLSKVIGITETSFIVHVSGALLLIILLFMLNLGQGRLSAWPSAPWHSLLGGTLGVVIICLVVSSINQLGAANATTAIIIGQLAAAIIIDHFGLFGLDPMPYTSTQLLGLVLLVAGAKLLLRH